MRLEFEIGGYQIGPGRPIFLIAEAGVNHNGSLDLALRLIDVASAAGANVVKFQTFRAATLAAASAPKAKYQIENTGMLESQYEMLRRLELTREMHEACIARCRAAGVLFLSTPFDQESADMLEELDVVAFKLPSGELTNLPLLRHVARKGKPMIISTGMATLGEVEAALCAIEEEGNDRVVVLHCISNYPAAAEEVNLRAMGTIGRAFNVPVGYSDHTLGIEISIAAAALGATVIEKHFTTDRTLPGPDHVASLEPEELKALVQGIRNVERAMGDGVKRPSPSELSTAEVARKSLVAAASLPAGTVLDRDHITILRPGTGLPPSMLPQLLGRTLRVPVSQGTLYTMEMFL